MPLSRLRLRIAVAFALAFAAGLVLVSAIGLGFLWRESHRRLDARLERIANDVRTNLSLELRETPDSSNSFVASEVVGEWPRNGGSYVICDGAGVALASTDSGQPVGALEHHCSDTASFFDVKGDDEASIRGVSREFRIAASDTTMSSKARTFHVVSFASTAGISEDTELLLVAIGVAAPLILLISLSGGYIMARRALTPVSDLSVAIASIAPNDLSRRLNVAEPQDELGTVATEFNRLLGRLGSAQEQNRKFLREAAHQIRTPLTLVLGEAAYELAADETSPEQMRGSLKRIGNAAERMRRRVDELFLLAEAQTGEPVSLREEIELDGLVLDAVDLMRPRSTALGRALAIGRAEHIVIRGNTALLQEALLELTENALRHGDASEPVTVSVFTDGNATVLEVRSGGAPVELPVRTRDAGPQGLGLPIVRWVAEVHGGQLVLQRDGQVNLVRLRI